MSAMHILPPLQICITERDAMEWAQILDDGNPLHSDADALAAHGIGRGIVNPGPANMGYLMTLLLNSFPGASIEEFDARFVGIVLAPSEVEACGRIEREELSPTGRILHCSLELRAAGAIAVTAKARLRVDADGASDLPRENLA
jgi:acyl dehydratase